MLNDYKKFTESLLNKLIGPTEEEILNNLLSQPPNKMLTKSLLINFKKGVLKAIDLGADIFDENYKFIGVKRILDIHNNNDFKIIDMLRKIENPNKIMEYSLKYEILNGVKLALEKGADINEIYIFNNKTNPLIYSIGRGYDDITNYLLDNDANIHYKKEEALLTACMLGNFKIIKRLIELGGNINHDGWCMDYALDYQTLLHVKFLLYIGFDIYSFGDDVYRFTDNAKIHGIDLVKLDIEVKLGKYNEEMQSLLK